MVAYRTNNVEQSEVLDAPLNGSLIKLKVTAAIQKLTVRLSCMLRLVFQIKSQCPDFQY